MSYTNQKVSSPILGQRNFAYARNHPSARSPILGEGDSSEDELDNVSVANYTTTYPGMSRRKTWQPPVTLRKPLTAMARQTPARQLSSSPEYTPVSPAFATVGFNSPRSHGFAPRSPNFNSSSSGPESALYARYQPQPQSPAPGPSYLPDYRSPGMNYREHFTSCGVGPQSSFAKQPQAMPPTLTNGLFRHLGSMNNYNHPWNHSNAFSRKRPFEDADDLFAPPPKRREYSATNLFGLFNETSPRAADQTLQNAHSGVSAVRSYRVTPAEQDVEMSNSSTPANSDKFAGMAYEPAPSTPRGLTADEHNKPEATFPYELEYTTTELAYGPNYTGPPGFVALKKPISAPVSSASSLSTVATTQPVHRTGMLFSSSPPRNLSQLPSIRDLFHHQSPVQNPQVSSNTSNNDYPVEPQNNVNNDNINHNDVVSPSPQRSIRAEVFHSLEARHGSVDSDAGDPVLLRSYSSSPASSEGSVHDTENQNSIENLPDASPQEENTNNGHETDSVTLADTPRLSIEAPDNLNNASVVSNHSNNNNVDNNNDQLLMIQEKVSNFQGELDYFQSQLDDHRGELDDVDDKHTHYYTRISTLSTDVEVLEQKSQAQSDETTQLRNQINTLKAEASERQSRFDELVKLVVEVTERSNLHGEQIINLARRSAGADNEAANNNNNKDEDEVTTLKEEVARLQKEVLTLQNEALKKEIAELRANRNL
ncbi:hypothetical protein EAE96_003408 [Botrytis aclada]|nr:hypothetical protein EAE96_003408 [Botrytis aclada]